MTPDFDRHLAAWLAPPDDGPGDRAFMVRVDTAIDAAGAAQVAFAAAQRRFARAFLAEAAAILALLAGLWILSRSPALAPWVGGGHWTIASPLALILLLWLGLQRPRLT